MTELEIKRVCQIRARLALQVREVQENGKIPTQQAQEATRPNRPIVQAGRAANTRHACHIRQTIHKEPSSKERSIRRDAN